MPIARLKTQQLTAGERTDLEDALGDPARFHFDGKEVGLAAIILPLLMYGFGLERRKALIDAHVSARVRPFRSA